MATKTIRSRSLNIGIPFTLATADDLDGTLDKTQAAIVTGAQRLIIDQINNGTLGTAGIDAIEISRDGGFSWAVVTDLLLTTADDVTGTVAVAGVLNAAGVEPVAGARFKCGPYDGPVMIRCGRKTTDSGGTTWVTGAPTVTVTAIGLGAGALTAGA